jgi:response regulator RpfG family c-di-GMP phosphodiesterase
VLRALTRVLRRDGYRILTAATPREAFQHLARHDVQVILSDQRMPESNGTEFLRQVKAMYPDTVRMLLSGYSDVAAVREALAEGAIAKFLTKPWNDEDLRRQIEDAFQIASRSRRQTEVPDR